MGGRQLVFVRYNNGHDTHREWVYNGPRFDNQAVVWAHDLGPVLNQKLIDNYGGRRVIWRVNGDQQPVRLEGNE
ncbi:MAG: hypothetical protein MUC42_06350 [Bryobacter sp.]|jgi:hypothetical protein|nr:hypothetical protein [Bryobacter sp.]